MEYVQCVEKSAYIFSLIVFARTLDVSKYHAFEWSGICVICVRIPDRVTVFIGVFCLPARINKFKMLNVCVCVKHSQSPETPHRVAYTVQTVKVSNGSSNRAYVGIFSIADLVTSQY